MLVKWAVPSVSQSPALALALLAVLYLGSHCPHAIHSVVRKKNKKGLRLNFIHNTDTLKKYSAPLYLILYSL